MNPEENRDALQAMALSPADAETEREKAELPEPARAQDMPPAPPPAEHPEEGADPAQPEGGAEEARSSAPTGVDGTAAAAADLQPPLDDESLQVSADREPESAGLTPSVVVDPAPDLTSRSFFQERLPQLITADPIVLRRRTRREVLLFGAGALAALAGAGSLLPQATLERLGLVHTSKPWPKKEWFLDRALRIDDDVAEALYSQNRLVPTYTKSQITPLKNNYNGATPDPGYIPEWKLELHGLASGLSVSLNLRDLLTRFHVHDQITRLVCVEGWSAIAWWSGLRFDDLLRAYPPMSQAKWVRVESSVNLDAWGNPDPYFVSLDLPSARHPQTLLATHFNGQPLSVDHGAPLRLLVPVKLGLKNVKAVTKLSFVAEEPKDYWAERGYSRYDGI